MIRRVREDLPTGRVTFLFTDVEGSTPLLHELGDQAYGDALAEHRRVVRQAFRAHGGVEVDTQGDAFFVVFPTASAALAAARDCQRALSDGSIRVRMGIHTGTPRLIEEGYVGMDVHKAARIAAAGHGGQILLSQETREQVEFDVSDLGEHRLKDFAEPICLFQLGRERFPPLRTISNTNLPRPASSFIGREFEVAEVATLLRGGARLLTLTGAGGSGKTRLAIEAAAELVPEVRNGVFWVGCASLRDPRLVLDTIARALGAKDGLAEHIGEREMLLLLDNLEQVIQAAPALAALAEACPNLILLITSRELLRVRGEVVYPVLPLSDPAAVELFCERSRLDPDETIAELCRRIDNLPLAVELAAARTSVLSPIQIQDRLSGRLDLFKGGRDADARQRTLRATIAWSHDLLTAREQRLFGCLAVFRGGCSVEAAEHICEAEVDTLQSLVDKSLLRHRGERFWLLETIREYAAERLDTSTDADEIRRRHAEYFLALAEETEPGLRGRAPWQSVERLANEEDNLRAALDHLQASRETEALLRLVGALGRFWSLRAAGSEGRQRLEAALAIDERATPARAKALLEAASLDHSGGNPARAKIRAEQALTLNRQFGDAWGIARSMGVLSSIALDVEGDLPKAQQILEETIERFRDIGHDHHALIATGNLALVRKLRGDRDGARALWEDVLRQARASRDEYMETTALDDLAEYAIDEGRVDDGLSMLQQSIRVSTRLTRAVRIHENLLGFAYALAAQKKPEIAAQLLAFSTMRIEQTQSVTPYGVAHVAEMKEKTLTLIRDDLEGDALAEAWEQGRRLSDEEALALAVDSID
jgi:predicted ATPase/class 3 adenylate cyclase